MATFPWAAFTDRGDVISTGLNSLADATISAAGTEVDNSTNLDTHAVVEVVLASLNPTGNPYVSIYMTTAPDGTNYQDAPVTGGTNQNMLLCTIPIPTGSAAKRVISKMVRIPPMKLKLYLDNQLNVALGASGNTVAFYTGTMKSV
jgi:hypothetical protein